MWLWSVFAFFFFSDSDLDGLYVLFFTLEVRMQDAGNAKPILVQANVLQLNAALASLASKSISWRISMEVLCRMDNPDIVSFSSIVAALRNSINGLTWIQSLETVSVMNAHGIQKDLICVNSLIAACEKVCMWQYATMAFTESGLSLDSTGYGALITAKGGPRNRLESHWRLSLTWLEEVKKKSPALANQICYNSCVDACGKGGQWEMSFRLLDQMFFQPDEVTLTSQISAFSEATWEKATQTLGLMRMMRISPNLHSHTAAISAISSQNWRLAADFWHQLSYIKLKPNQITCNALLIAEKRNWQRSFALLRMTTTATLQLTNLQMNSCLSAACQPGSWPIMSHLLERMQKLKIQGNVDTFSAVVSAYEKNVLWQNALHMWMKMSNKHLQPDTISLNAMTSAFAHGLCWKLAMQCLGQIRCTIPADFITRNAILTSCGGVHQWQMALDFFDSEADMEAHSVMIASCASSFQWTLGLRILGRMTSAEGAALAVALTSSLKACLGHGSVGAGTLEVPKLLFQLEDSACAAILATIKDIEISRGEERSHEGLPRSFTK